jgi:hypothetical protein
VFRKGGERSHASAAFLSLVEEIAPKASKRHSHEEQKDLATKDTKITK